MLYVNTKERDLINQILEIGGIYFIPLSCKLQIQIFCWFNPSYVQVLYTYILYILN